MNNPKTDKEKYDYLNKVYGERIHELCEGDLAVIDGIIVIKKRGGSNNYVLFSDEAQLSMFLDGIEGQQIAYQYTELRYDINHIIDECKDMSKAIKDCPEYFSDDWDESIIDLLGYIVKILDKYK